MTTLEICSVDDYFSDPTGNETDFPESDNTSDWDGIEIITNEDNLITNESTESAESIMEAYRKECWQCTRCNTINNVRQCIKKHGSKCVGCKTECYIEYLTPTIMRSEYHTNDELFRLQMDQLWQCESCLTINDKSIALCTECNKPSKKTIIRRKIKKFTKEEKAEYLIHGFVREHDYYLEIKKDSIYSVLFQLIQKFYVIDYLEAGWIIGNVKCMSIIEASNLKVGDKVDHRHYVGGPFKAAKVKEISSKSGECKFKLEYEGIPYRAWSSWHDYNDDPLKFAEAGAVSSRPAHRLKGVKVGDQVDINPIYNERKKKHMGWKRGRIKQIDSKSGQVAVSYWYGSTSYTHWAHLDNKDEIAEYGLMTSNIGKTMADLLRDDIRKQRKAKGNLGDAW